MGANGESSVAVIGAGVAGLSTAINLQRLGVPVTLLDPLPSPGGASFGNGGFISPETVVPIALPGMLRKVPGWLMDPLGPLSVRPVYFPRAMPWLWQWVRAGRLSRVREISDALHELHRDALKEWKSILGDADYYDLIRDSGQIMLWDTVKKSPANRLERSLQDRHGVVLEELGPDDLQQLLPGLSRDVVRGDLMPRNSYTVSPARLIGTLATKFRSAGGILKPERVLKIIPRQAGGLLLFTNVSNHVADNVVIAGGAWSRQLLEPLGVKAPLELERGYHVMLPSPSISLRMPFIHKSRAIGMTPMEDGIRVAGTIEFAGLDAPPDERRANILYRQALKLFPDLRDDKARMWMGHRPGTPDSMPVLGPVTGHKGLFVCFGHGHFGMTGGPPSGRLVAELVAGRRPSIDPRPYSLDRFSLA